MSRPYAPEKTVEVPPFGRVDISRFLPLINTPEFQRMKRVKQLGLVSEIFPFATHTRYAHVLGVAGLTEATLRSLFARGCFAPSERDQLSLDLGAVALLHDIQHPPYSHILEVLLTHAQTKDKRKDHKARSIDFVRDVLPKEVASCGADLDNVIRYMNKRAISPGNLVTSRSLGSDKRAYLAQDQLVTGHPAGDINLIRALTDYIVYDDRGVALEEKGLQLAKGMQSLYFGMWTGVYLRKQCLAAERMLQKALQLCIQDSGTDPETIWNRTDAWIDMKLEESTNQIVTDLYSRICRRDVLKTAIALKRAEYVPCERVAGKEMQVLPLSENEVRNLGDYYADPFKVTDLERKIATALNLEESELIVTTLPEPDKLMPEDIRFVNVHGCHAGLLSGMLPRFYSQLKEEAEAFYAFRVMVPQYHRLKVSQAGNEVREIINEHLRTPELHLS